MATALHHPPRSGERRALSDAERHDFARLQEAIDRGQKDFRTVALALREILERRLYRESHGTFDDYCRVRWGFQKGWGHKLAQAGRVIEKQEANGLPAPRTERHARRINEALAHTDGEANAPRKTPPRAGGSSGSQETIELAAAVTKQIEGHLRTLEELHARHVCSASATHTLLLFRQLILPWPPR